MRLPHELRSLGPIFTRSSALEAGSSAYVLERTTADGALVRFGRGLYRVPVELEDGQPWEVARAEHLRRCREAQAVHPGHVISHQSAAVVHGMQLRLHPAMSVHLTSVDRAPCSRREPGLVMHHADSVSNDVAVVDGIRTTTPARTIADVLRTSRPPNSVALFDAAVRDGLVTAQAVRRVLDTQVRWRGRPRARQAMQLHDPRRESWLESFSFVALHELGVPLPEPQVQVLDEGFHFVGRVDGLLGSVFLEADGESKYYLLTEELGLTPAESVARVLEKQSDRHERLVGLGLQGVRWTTREIQREPGLVARRIWAAVNTANPADFNGWLRIGDRITRPQPLPHRAAGCVAQIRSQAARQTAHRAPTRSVDPETRRPRARSTLRPGAHALGRP
ncbi:type IV toxin-antitoxin system AbiEi family antitoxin domain-containing protein [Ornithinimicrobium faecis]|nr:type IV toxin-antitoxin system AbiEi family antitoxin domain-containing protein [Ornithinimicrobium sp. HY1745]